MSAELENGFPLWFYYQGGDSQAGASFPVGKFTRVELIGKLCVATVIEKRTPSLTFSKQNCHFEASGLISDIVESEGERLYILDSEIRLLFDNENGQSPITCGAFVSVKGELWVDNWWS